MSRRLTIQQYNDFCYIAAGIHLESIMYPNKHNASKLLKQYSDILSVGHVPVYEKSALPNYPHTIERINQLVDELSKTDAIHYSTNGRFFIVATESKLSILIRRYVLQEASNIVEAIKSDESPYDDVVTLNQTLGAISKEIHELFYVNKTAGVNRYRIHLTLEGYIKTSLNTLSTSHVYELLRVQRNNAHNISSHLLKSGLLTESDADTMLEIYQDNQMQTNQYNHIYSKGDIAKHFEIHSRITSALMNIESNTSLRNDVAVNPGNKIETENRNKNNAIHKSKIEAEPNSNNNIMQGVVDAVKKGASDYALTEHNNNKTLKTSDDMRAVKTITTILILSSIPFSILSYSILPVLFALFFILFFAVPDARSKYQSRAQKTHETLLNAERAKLEYTHPDDMSVDEFIEAIQPKQLENLLDLYINRDKNQVVYGYMLLDRTAEISIDNIEIPWLNKEQLIHSTNCREPHEIEAIKRYKASRPASIKDAENAVRDILYSRQYETEQKAEALADAWLNHDADTQYKNSPLFKSMQQFAEEALSPRMFGPSAEPLALITIPRKIGPSAKPYIIIPLPRKIFGYIGSGSRMRPVYEDTNQNQDAAASGKDSDKNI